MYRKLSALILIALIALMTVQNAHAAPSNAQEFTVFMTDFRNGTFYAALYNTHGDPVTPIKFELADGETFEDMLPAYGNTITVALELNQDNSAYTDRLFAYSTEYGKVLTFTYVMIDESDQIEITNVVNRGTYFEASINGLMHQFNGSVMSGSATLLRNADAYSTNGIGYIVQDGTLISMTASNGEESPMHRIYVPVVLF